MATQHQAQTRIHEEGVTVRVAGPEDARECGRICYEAFSEINTRHGFQSDFPNPDIPTGILSRMFSHPGFYAVVAERAGKILGSNCQDERSPIAGIGPITIDPGVQNQGVGWMLMRAVLDHAALQDFPGVRLVQAAFHNRSLSLYAKLGFRVREPLAVMQGPPIGRTSPGYQIRSATHLDVDGCNRLCLSVHGHDRAGELVDAVKEGTAVIAERAGRITAYATALAFFGHAIGETNSDLQALIASAHAFLGPGILVPTRNEALFRWCLENGLRVVEPMTLMTLGLYSEPNGAYLPSILY